MKIYDVEIIAATVLVGSLFTCSGCQQLLDPLDDCGNEQDHYQDTHAESFQWREVWEFASGELIIGSLPNAGLEVAFFRMVDGCEVSEYSREGYGS